MDPVKKEQADTGDAAVPDAGLGPAPSVDDILTPEAAANISEKSGKLLMFFVEMALNGGNAGAAAEAVEWTAQYGRLVVSQNPGIRDQLANFHRRNAEDTLVTWKSMQTKAMRRLNRIIDESTDEMALLRAIEMVVERVEGKVTQRVDANVNVSQVSAQSVLMRFVSSLHMLKGVSVAEALEWANANPEAVEEWGKSTLLLGPGKDVTPPA